MGLQIFVEPQEHVNGRAIVGRADEGDLHPTDMQGYPVNFPPDPVRPSEFDKYRTDTGVFGAGIEDSRVSRPYYINPHAKHGQRDFFNENVSLPGGKPAVIWDNRGRVLDDRTQYPGQQPFRYDTNIPRPAYMTFSDLLDQEGVT